MSIAEKLQTIAENEQRVYDAGYEKGKSEGGGSGTPTTPTDDRTSMSYWYMNIIGNQWGRLNYDDEGMSTYEESPPLESVKFPIGTQDIEDFSNFAHGVYFEDGMAMLGGVWTKRYEGTLDARKATSMAYAFAKNKYLEELGGEILFGENIKSVERMFEDCSALQKVPHFYTGNVTNFDYMLAYCSKLKEIPQFDTSSGTGFSNMFYGCSNVTKMPQLNTSKGTNFYSMFDSCRGLTEVPPLDTSSGTKFNSMFRDCTKLTTIPRIDFSSVTEDLGTYDFYQPFVNCSALINLTIAGTIRVSNLNLKWSTKLSKASITSVINALDANVSGKKITLSRTAVTNAFGSTDNADWISLRDSKLDWTISLFN